MDEEDHNALFVTLAIVLGLLALGSPALLWALGMHMGFGGSELYTKTHWFKGDLYYFNYEVPPSYGPGTAWPIVIGYSFIFPGVLALVGTAYKTTKTLRKVAHNEPD